MNRTVPRALLLSCTGMVLLYGGLQLACQGILGGSLPTFTDAPLAEAVRVLGSPAAGAS